MATFRTGFKIIGELSLKQGLGRIRSFSEDRKPGSWAPEDQWAVRPPCSICPDPCNQKKPKSSKSWLSICKDEDVPCDVRQTNCPAPKEEEPWYAFITKKKPAKPKPPLSMCRLEHLRQAEKEEEVCEKVVDKTWPGVFEKLEPEEQPCPERPPAPVIRLSCPPPKDIDLMLWCGKPGISVARIASQCQSDKMPYEEFRPKKSWKNPPFSLPSKCDAPAHQPFCSNVGRAPYAEYKQVDIPKPLYTRYKSVELQDENFLLSMTVAKCPTDEKPSFAIQPPPLQKSPKTEPPQPKPADPSPEKPVLVAGSLKPVKLKCAPKYKFRPKPTKLVERRQYRNPCSQHKTFNLNMAEQQAGEVEAPQPEVAPQADTPKVISSNLTDEPQIYERSLQPKRPPTWMYMLSKPGSKDTPLLPHVNPYPNEPDQSGETDGLRFYDGRDEGISPKPPPDPCKRVANQPDAEPPKPNPCVTPPEPEPVPTFQEKFVLMPEKFNIRNMRPPEEKPISTEDFNKASFQEFIEAKSTSTKPCSKLYPPVKENILYDLIRNSPLPPFDPSKMDPPPRKAPPVECPRPQRFYYRRYSTWGPYHYRKFNHFLNLSRMKSEDSRSKCKARNLVPKPRPCGPPPRMPSCNEMEMPCCPKAKIPPNCNVKKPMPQMKKRLPPKPSYSECSKDPPPCPRITECNCWEKRDMENKKKSRKFSSWAPVRAMSENESTEGLKAEAPKVTTSAAESPSAVGPSNSEYLDVIESGKSFINKNKWSSSKYLDKPRKIFSGKELMLNFVNPTEDSNSYYTTDSLLGNRKPKRKKLKSSGSQLKVDAQSNGNELHERKVISALLQDHHTRNDTRIKNLNINNREAALGVSNAPEDCPRKPLTGSIGSWINGLIKAQKRRSNSCPAPGDFPSSISSTTYVETVDVDRMLKLTNPFRHRKSSSDDIKQSIYPLAMRSFDRSVRIPSSRRFWDKRRSRSLDLFPSIRPDRAQASMWKYESLSPDLEMNQTAECQRREPSPGIENLHFPRRLLVKNDKRLGKRNNQLGKPAAEVLSSKSLLLNINNSGQSGIDPGLKPESVRCYSIVTNSTQDNCFSHKYSEICSRLARENRSGKKKKVPVTRINTGKSKEFSSFDKNRTILVRPENWAIQLRYTETNIISEHLVQNLIKKVKTSRSGLSKRKESNSANKSRFRQSATNSLVHSVIAKREIEAHNSTKSPKASDGKLTKFFEAEKAVTPLSIPHKSWIYIDRGYDTNLKYDVKKNIAHATVIKSKPKKWFNMDELHSDYFYDSKKSKKKSESELKNDLKYCADKFIKRQEVRNMLSKLELKKHVMKVAENSMKMRQKEQNKKDIMNMLENQDPSQHSEKFGGKFAWQHALFRSHTRNSNPQKSFFDMSGNDSPLGSQAKSLIDFQNGGAKSLETSVGDVPKKVTNNVELYDADLDEVGDCWSLEEKSTPRIDLRKVAKTREAAEKMKLLKGQKPKEMEKIIGCYTYEKPELLESKQPRQIPTAAMARANFKPLQARRLSTEKPACPDKKPPDGKAGSDRPKSKEFGKGSSDKNEKDDKDCRWDPIKKPGPNCPDG